MMKYSVIIVCVVILYSQSSDGYSSARNKYYVSETVDKGTSVKYIRQSSPFRIFECMTRSPLLRCLKLFAWIKLEQFPLESSSGNLTQDFMTQFLSREENFPSLLDKRFDKMSENELTKKLVYYLRNFFKNRELKVNFVPGIVFHFTPNMDNNLKMSITKDNVDSDNSTDIEEVEERGHRRKKKKDKGHHHKDYKHTVIQMAVPVLMMPAILLGTFLPFMLPALKMATIMSVIVNNAALIAALMHAARTHVMNQETEIVHYSPHGATY